MDSDDEAWNELDDVQIAIGDCLNLDALSKLVDDMTHTLINIDAPDWYMNPDFGFLFGERSSYDSIAACSSLSFPPNLHDVLTSPVAPSIAFLKSLPLPAGDFWAIYVIVMEKDGCPTLVYIGSGTDAIQGVSARLPHYVPGCAAAPRFVRHAFRKGYHVAHRGLLCWTPLPNAGLVPRVRARFLALEALFTCLFFAAYAAVTDQYHEHLLRWEREAVEWGPLCSHISLKEDIKGDIYLSAEEVEIVAALRKKHRAQYIKDHRAARRGKDVDAYRAHERVTKNAWSARHRVALSETSAMNRQNAIAARRFHCDVCDMSLQSQHALDKHLGTEAHADAVDGVQKSEMSQYALNLKAQRAANKAACIHHCSVCNKSFENDWSLTRHKEGKRHIAKEAKASG
ncbi:hypothetical protein N0V83_005533 [Neocucurbitaria cava]|uniref:C2H2-type domain-containing protein n=1 Tax=Neocucurbitaria cava TaxID=798079 RepID=A0A9W8Y7G8_9PLEO|nr:hypothetical protein N0V83_005533 [Neocucurbitaria cava]